jgi:hypothetical protein
MTKLCKDCVFYKRSSNSMNIKGYLDECICPALKKNPNPVTGEVNKTYCSTARDYDILCGKNGKYWKSADPQRPEPNIQDSWLNKIFNIF